VTFYTGEVIAHGGDEIWRASILKSNLKPNNGVAMSLLVILIILLVLLGGGGFYAGGPRVGIGLGGLILIILVILALTGRL
jgi:hypothetical protein